MFDVPSQKPFLACITVSMTNKHLMTRLTAITLLLAAIPVAFAAGKNEDSFKKDYKIDKSELSSTGAGPYFVLEPGFTAVFEGREKGKAIVLTITMTDETKTVDGVETRVVEEKETANGEMSEISHNYFAISKKTGDVYYFGEDTDEYEQGKKKHGKDSWLSGVNGAHFGLAVPGHPEKGLRYYQELAPKVAMDRAEIISAD